MHLHVSSTCARNMWILRCTVSKTSDKMHLLVCYLNKLQNARCNDKDGPVQFKKNGRRDSTQNITYTNYKPA